MKRTRVLIAGFMAALSISLVSAAFAVGHETYYPVVSPDMSAKVDTRMPEKWEAFSKTYCPAVSHCN